MDDPTTLSLGGDGSPFLWGAEERWWLQGQRLTLCTAHPGPGQHEVQLQGRQGSMGREEAWSGSGLLTSPIWSSLTSCVSLPGPTLWLHQPSDLVM